MMLGNAIFRKRTLCLWENNSMKSKEVPPPHGEEREVGNLKHHMLTIKELRSSIEVKGAWVGPVGVGQSAISIQRRKY